MMHDMLTRSTTQAHALYSATTSAMGLHRDLVIAGQDGDVRWSEHDVAMLSPPPEGSGPIRLGSSFRFQSSKNPVIVALALAQGESAEGTGCRIVPSIAWMVEVCPCLRTCPLMTLSAILTA